MEKRKYNQAIFLGTLPVSALNMAEIFLNDEFVHGYHTIVQQLVKAEFDMTMNVNKKYKGADVLSISLLCKTCKKPAKLSVKKLMLATDPVIWQYQADCMHRGKN